MDNNQNPENIIDKEENASAETAAEHNSEDAEIQENTSADTEQDNTLDNGSDTENAPPSQNRGIRIISAIYDYVEIFAIAIVAVLFIFTFCVRLCRVDGNSMNNTLKNDEMIIASNFFYTPKQGDIIVFHLSNDYYEEPLVKRVIATEGQTVEINLTTKELKVDGVVYADKKAFFSGDGYDMRVDFNKNYLYKANGQTYFAATVPEGHVFVLGDNRNGSSDSRTSRVGFVDMDTILGKAVVRLSPFTVLE